MAELFTKFQDKSISCEMQIPDYEKKFCRLVAAEIATDLQTPYASRDVVVNLLTTCLEQELCSRDGLLEQYLHSQLDILAQNINKRFSIPDLNVNYQYATHAKLNDILLAIEKKHKKELEDATPKQEEYFGSI